MTTQVDKEIEVGVPIRTAYNQWTQFEEFPQFMGGVNEVRQLGDRNLHWVAQIAGVRREWDAEVIEQVPDQKVAWAATEGATNAGAVYFSSLGPDRTVVRLHLEYEPEGVVEKVGDTLSIVAKQAESDLKKFKSFIESRGTESGSWRGEVPGNVGTPDIEAAEETRGDSGKAGVSGKAVAAGAAAAAVAGVAAAAAAKGKSGSNQDDEAADAGAVPVEPVVVTEVPAETTYPDTTYTDSRYDTDPDRPRS
jgi:Polyketide cyclase / dehydrase and lipid transport